MKKLKPLISVCVPVYNGEKYLADCLLSIIAQSYTNIEILIVDDLSTDKSLEVAKTFAQSEKRIRIVENAFNLGLVSNWNQCIRNSRGEWIKFVFQDDLINQDCLLDFSNYFDSGPSVLFSRRDFIFSPDITEELRSYYINHASFVHKLFSNVTRIDPAFFIGVIAKDFDGYFYPINYVGEPSSIIIKKRVFDQYGLFDPQLVQKCDFEFMNRVAVNEPILYVEKTLSSFRVHSDSTSMSNLTIKKFQSDFLDPIYILKRYLSNSLYAPLRAMLSKKAISLNRELFRKLFEAENYLNALNGNGLVERRLLNRVLDEISFSLKIRYRFFKIKSALDWRMKRLARKK